MTQPVAAAEIDLAEALADAARAVIRGYFRRTIAVDDKSDLSPVTVADREAEAAMLALILRRIRTAPRSALPHPAGSPPPPAPAAAPAWS